MSSKTILAAAASAAALAAVAALPAHAGTVVATISGSYDGCAYDTPCLVIHNSSGGVLHDATLDLNGYQGLNFGNTAHVDLGDLPAGDTQYIWNGAFTPGNLLSFDYDDE